ncbi:MAG: Ig-like domain-containing protein, partial [Bacteroidota bacterium]
MKSVPLIQKVARSALDKGIRELLLFFSIILLALPGFSQVDLVLSPASPTVNVGDPISIVLEVQAGTTDIVAVQAFLDYDPNLITVNSVDYEPGNEFPVLSGPTFSTLGQIDVAGNTFSTISGTFDLITINFTATAVGVASIDFHTPTGSSRVTDVADPAVQSVLGTTTGASINIIGPNAPPTVSITSPGNGTAFIEGANVVVIADASDSDGTITNVEFFDGVNSLGTDNTDPYSITITNIAQGTYSLTAVATDDDDESTTSSVVNITVNPAQVDTEPVITLDANATVNEGGNINVPLSILDADGDNLT